MSTTTDTSSFVNAAYHGGVATADLGPKFRGGQMLSGGAYLRAQNVSGGVCLFCGSRRQYLI